MSLFQKIAAFLTALTSLQTVIDDVTTKLTALDAFLDTTP